MPTYSGSMTMTSSQGIAAQPVPCQLEFDLESLTLIPSAGSPLSLDLGDIDELAPREYELFLELYTGERILLSRFGKSFQDLGRALQEAYRTRMIQCLLLEDLEEVARFDGTAELHSQDGSFTAPAELRLYQSNLAVLPQGHTGLQWRLAEINSVAFDEARYAVVLQSGEDRLTFTRLAKRTREFMDKLQAAITEVAGRSAITVRTVFPFLSPDQFRRTAELVKEGRVAPIAQLTSIHPKTLQALTERVVAARLKPYYDYLCNLAGSDGFYAGFKLIRKEAEPETEEAPYQRQAAEGGTEEKSPGIETAPVPPEGESDDGNEILHWFLFPLRSPGATMPDLAAWETTSRSGRATYFFRLLSAAEAAKINPGQAAAAIDSGIRRLNRGLLMLNFRREPIYLPDDSLQLQPKYRRYAIAARKIPVLRFLRTSFLGRAIHTTAEAWQKQVQQKTQLP
jgi:hypothetical protein